jgi:zinc transporter, ZIP family
MSFAETVLLGALAGFTIFIGLPVGRLCVLGDRTRVALAMFAVGILAFIFVDVMEHANELVDGALTGYKDGSSSFGRLAGYAALLIGGFGAGSAGLTVIERRMRRSTAALAPMAGGSEAAVLSPAALETAQEVRDAARQRALRTGMVIAAAIGLHNFAEGLAIGVSAQAGEVSLATVLIIGFALHNATEGFGIVGPLGSVRPSWRWLALAGLVGGGPTFVGSMVGYEVASNPLELAFYALAGGAILYVVWEIVYSVRRYGHRELAAIVLTCGFAAGVLTDLVVAYGGG